MSFEIKYDKNGNVVTPPPVVEQEPVEQPVLNTMLSGIQQPQDWPTEVEEQLEEDIVEELPEPVYAAPQTKNPEVNNSWAELREAKRRAEQERDQAMRMLQEAQKAPQKSEEDYSVNLNDDDLAEGRHITKVQKEVRNLKQQLSDYQNQMQQMTLEAKIKAQYPDFDAIVSKDNIAALNQSEPELAMSIGANRDLYSQAVSAYKAIKRMGIAASESHVDMQQIERVKKNSVKPKSTASIAVQGESPLSRANGFVDGKMSKDLQNRLYREMLEAAKRS